MAGNDNGRDISRRQFTATLGAVAGLSAGANLLTPAEVSAAPHINPRIIGANDRVVVASIGVRGQGNSVKRGFAKLANVEIKTLCDVDENVGRQRLEDKALAEVASYKPGYEQDLRKVFADKDVDAVIIATPNHWHALATIWGLQAGKHVYVEKPASHTVVEGRRMVQATARYKKIVQVGTMNRSRPAVIKAIEFIKGGGIGKVYMARGLCFKPRPGIGKYPDGPMAAGEQYKLNEATNSVEPIYDAAYLAKVNYDLWLGPAPLRPFNRNRFHYNWHWHWDYGNGDTGNQGPHQFDIARWGLGKQEHPVKIKSVGGYFGPPASQETPDLQTTTYEYGDGVIMEFATRGQATNAEGPVEIGNIFYGTEGYLWIDADGRQWQSYPRPQGREGTGRRRRDGRLDRQRSARPHQHRVPALSELHRRHPRRRSEAADLRRARRPPVVGAAAPGQHLLPRRPGAGLRFQERDDRRRQGSERAPDAAVPQGLRAAGHQRRRRHLEQQRVSHSCHHSGVVPQRLRSGSPTTPEWSPHHSGVVWQFLRLPCFAGLTVS